MKDYIKQIEVENEELRKQLATTQYQLQEQKQLNKINLEWSGPSHIRNDSTSYFLRYGKMIIAVIVEQEGIFTGSSNGYNVVSCNSLEEAKDALINLGIDIDETEIST